MTTLLNLIFFDEFSVPIEYDEPTGSFDLDTEQSEARYDPRLLSEEFRGTHSVNEQGAEACMSSNTKYEHGEKVKKTLIIFNFNLIYKVII